MAVCIKTFLLTAYHKTGLRPVLFKRRYNARLASHHQDKKKKKWINHNTTKKNHRIIKENIQHNKTKMITYGKKKRTQQPLWFFFSKTKEYFFSYHMLYSPSPVKITKIPLIYIIYNPNYIVRIFEL